MHHVYHIPEDDADRHEVRYDDGETDFLQLETLNVRHTRDDVETFRVMWMFERPDMAAEAVRKQLEIHRNKNIHKRKAEYKQP